jgi:hypothetical protein
MKYFALIGKVLYVLLDAIDITEHLFTEGNIKPFMSQTKLQALRSTMYQTQYI